MGTLFHVAVKTRDRGGAIAYVQKHTASVLIPPIGTLVESSGFKEPRKVVDVVVSADDGSVFVRLEELVFTAETLEVQAFSFAGHGWELSSELAEAADRYRAAQGLS